MISTILQMLPFAIRALHCSTILWFQTTLTKNSSNSNKGYVRVIRISLISQVLSCVIMIVRNPTWFFFSTVSSMNSKASRHGMHKILLARVKHVISGKPKYNQTRIMHEFLAKEEGKSNTSLRYLDYPAAIGTSTKREKMERNSCSNSQRQ